MKLGCSSWSFEQVIATGQMDQRGAYRGFLSIEYEGRRTPAQPCPAPSGTSGS